MPLKSTPAFKTCFELGGCKSTGARAEARVGARASAEAGATARAGARSCPMWPMCSRDNTAPLVTITTLFELVFGAPLVQY